MTEDDSKKERSGLSVSDHLKGLRILVYSMIGLLVMAPIIVYVVLALGLAGAIRIFD